jgi:hypothetical protein
MQPTAVFGAFQKIFDHMTFGCTDLNETNSKIFILSLVSLIFWTYIDDQIIKRQGCHKNNLNDLRIYQIVPYNTALRVYYR